LKQPPVSFFLKKAAGVKSGSKTTGRGFVGKVTRAQIREIAEKKLVDLNTHSIDAASAMIEAPPVPLASKWWSKSWRTSENGSPRRARHRAHQALSAQ